MADKKQLYERFKLQWMIDHGYTLTGLIAELEQLRKETEEETDLGTLFKEWEFGCGFGGEIWPCLGEFMDCDYEEFVKSIR